MANTGFNRNYLYNVYNRKQPETEGKTCIAGGTVYLFFLNNFTANNCTCVHSLSTIEYIANYFRSLPLTSM